MAAISSTAPFPGSPPRYAFKVSNFGLGDFLALVIAQIEEPNRYPEPFNCRLVNQQKPCSLHTPSLPLQVVQLNRGAVRHQAIPVLTESHLAKELGSINVAGLRARVLFFSCARRLAWCRLSASFRSTAKQGCCCAAQNWPATSAPLTARSSDRTDIPTYHHALPVGRSTATQTFERSGLAGKNSRRNLLCPAGSPEIRRLRAWQNLRTRGTDCAPAQAC